MMTTTMKTYKLISKFECKIKINDLEHKNECVFAVFVQLTQFRMELKRKTTCEFR